jgi:hypothetical protein
MIALIGGAGVAAMFRQVLAIDIDHARGGRKRTRSRSTMASLPGSGSRNAGSFRKRSSELDFVAICTEHVYCRARHIGIEKKAHARLGGRQRVKGFLLCKLAHKSERRSNVFGGKVVFALNVFERHSASQAANDYGYRYASAAKDRFTVGDGRVNNDAIWRGHGPGAPVAVAALVGTRPCAAMK